MEDQVTRTFYIIISECVKLTTMIGREPLTGNKNSAMTKKLRTINDQVAVNPMHHPEARASDPGTGRGD